MGQRPRPFNSAKVQHFLSQGGTSPRGQRLSRMSSILPGLNYAKEMDGEGKKSLACVFVVLQDQFHIKDKS